MAKAAKKVKKEKKAPRAPRNPRNLRLAAVLAVLLVLLCVVLYAVARVSDASAYAGVQDGFRSFFAGLSPGEGYPYALEASSVLQISPMNSGVAYLTGEASCVLNGTAKPLLVKKLSFQEPAMTAAHGRLLVYDRAGGAWFVQNASQQLLQKEMGSGVLTAALGKNGNVAVVTSAADAQGVLTVYDKSGKQLLEFRCETERIASVSLSDDGKNAAILTLGAQNAQYFSRLLIFAYDRAEPIYEEKFQNTAGIRLQYTDSGKLQLFADTLFACYSGSGERQTELVFPAGSLVRLKTQENGRCLFALQGQTGGALTTVYSYNRDGAKEFEKSCEDLRDIACGKSYSAILADGQLTVLDTAGAQQKQFPLTEYVRALALSGKMVYAVTLKSIQQYSF